MDEQKLVEQMRAALALHHAIAEADRRDGDDLFWPPAYAEACEATAQALTRAGQPVVDLIDQILAVERDTPELGEAYKRQRLHTILNTAFNRGTTYRLAGQPTRESIIMDSQTAHISSVSSAESGMISFKLAFHGITGQRIVEVYEGREFIAAIYPGDRAIKVVSKFAATVHRDADTKPVATVVQFSSEIER